MKDIKKFIAERGITIMALGFCMALAGVIATMSFNNTPRYAGTPMPALSTGMAIVGFATYIVGRVASARQRARGAARKRPLAEDEADE